MVAELSEHFAGWESVCGALGEIRTCHAAFEQFCSGLFDQLNALSGELSARREQWLQEHRQRKADVQQEAADAGQLQRALEDTRRQQARWEQERRALESELEAVRNRGAELAELLASEKRKAARQQSDLADELKRVRCLMEGMVHRFSEAAAGAPVVAPPPPAASATDSQILAGDPVLETVVAQFDMLQRDLARRRTGDGRPR